MWPSTKATPGTPSEPQPLYDNDDGTIALYQGATMSYTAADALRFKNNHVSPRELIVHESITSLIAEVAELRERCQSLEAANAELVTSLHALEQAFCDERAQTIAPLTTVNLTGYASSDTASEAPDGHNDTLPTGQRFHMIEQVLLDQNKRIETLETYTNKSGALFTALQRELHGLEPPSKVNGEGGAFDEDHKMPAELLSTVKSEMKRMGSALTARLATLEATVAVMAVRKSSNESSTMKTIEEGLHELKVAFDDHRAEYDQRRKYEQLIDDASTTDQLYIYYKQLSEAMFSPSNRGGRGPFHGTSDELFSLRGRVVRRLATFEATGTAMEEAKRADVDY